METRYTILVSTVTNALFHVLALAPHVQQPMTELRADKGLKSPIERGRILEAVPAAKGRQ